jgi:hypothetical protein
LIINWFGKNKTQVILLVGLSFLWQSCYEEHIRYPDPSNGEFNFMMTDEQEEEILNSRGERLLIESPDPFLYFDNVEYKLDRFQIRGESTLNFRRKSFSVNMDDRF